MTLLTSTNHISHNRNHDKLWLMDIFYMGILVLMVMDIFQALSEKRIPNLRVHRLYEMLICQYDYDYNVRPPR